MLHNNADTILFRASQMGSIMTNDRSGKAMGETAKKALLKIYASEVHGRYEKVKSKFLDKGNQREEDAITLLSRVTKKIFIKNTVRLSNQFFTGEPDLYFGKTITTADETLDTKCSWSLKTFLEAKFEPLNADYKYQGRTYLNLTGAKKHTIAYCLVNGTVEAIMKEKQKAGYEYGSDPDTNPAYILECQQIERNHIFDLAGFKKEYPWFDFHSDLSQWKYDIPIEDRVCLKDFDVCDLELNSMISRVEEARNYMNTNLF